MQSDQDPDAAEGDHDDGETLDRDAAVSGQAEDPDRHDAGQRQPGAAQPREHGTRGDAWDHESLGRAVIQGTRGGRAQEQLGEQVGRGGRDQAGDHDCDHHAYGERAGERGVDDPEHDRGHEPQRDLDDEQTGR